MKLFNKKPVKEMTEEEKKELEAAKAEKKQKVLEKLKTAGKIMVGVVALGVGVILVAAALGEDPENLKQIIEEGDEPFSDPEDMTSADVTVSESSDSGTEE